MTRRRPSRTTRGAVLASAALLVAGGVAGCSSGSGDDFSFDRGTAMMAGDDADRPDESDEGAGDETGGAHAESDDDAQDADTGASDDAVASSDGMVTLTEYSVVLGDPDASTQILIYQDLACPHCRSMHELVADDLEEWAESGDVAVEVVTVDFLARSSEDFSARAANLLATVALRHPDHVAAVQDAIFEAQDDDPDVAELVELAREAGADLTDAEAQDVEDQAAADRVEAATDHALDQGVSSVPQIFVDSEAVTGATYEEIHAALVAAVESSVAAG